MPTNQTSYRQIFKATTIFGGVQVINIIVTLIRAKIFSVLLGPFGMGINGLFLNTLALTKNISSLGIPESAIKQIAQAKGRKDNDALGRVVTIINRWIGLTIGTSVLAILLFAPWVSQNVFGNAKYISDLRLLSVAIIAGGLATLSYTLLRGMMQTRYLALANILGVVSGFLVGLPFIYYLGEEGIIYSILAASATALVIATYFRGKIHVNKVDLTWKESFYGGIEMVRLGVVLSLTMLLTAGATFTINAFISATGSISDVGLYNSAVSITTGYVGLVFNAMITDYFPRLAAAIREETLWKKIVSQQAELVILILGPILILLITTAPIVIRLLLTQEFLPITVYIPWAALAIFIQGLVWCMATIIVAKGDLKIKLYTEITGQLVFVGFSLLGYHLAGLFGLGVAILSSGCVNLSMILLIAHLRYRFKFSKKFVFLILLVALILILTAISTLWANQFTYIAGGVLFIISSIISIRILNHRINLKGIVIAYLSKDNRK